MMVQNGSYTSFTYYNEATDTWVTLGPGETVTIPRTSYSYSISNNNNKQKMMRGTNYCYWLASMYISRSSNGAVMYGVREVYYGEILGADNPLFCSNFVSTTGNHGTGVRPVVTLGPDVVLTTQDENGAWNLGISN